MSYRPQHPASGQAYMPYMQVYPTDYANQQQAEPLRLRTKSGGFRTESAVSPALLPLYVILMLMLPLSVFLFSAWTMRKHRMAELARNTSSPVTYVQYYTEPGKLSDDIEVDHVWVRVPLINETHANGVFASTQFMMEVGSGGYMGTQVRRKGATDPQFGWMFDSGVSHRVIFSIWDGDEDHKAVPGTDATSVENCERFGGEGTGAHCAVEYPLQQSTKITVRMMYDGRGDGGDMWTGFVKHPATGETARLGSILVPDMKGKEGFGRIQPWTSGNAFQEYWQATGCDDQAVSVVGVIGPYFNERKVTPSKAVAKYQNGCSHEDVSSCIPGFGCGHPRALMTAGGTTRHTAQDGDNIWAVPK